MKQERNAIVGTVLLVVASACPARADLAFETETARPIELGKAQVSAAAEYLFGKDGTELAFPLAIEYGLLRDFEILLEPVPFTTVHATGEKAVSGVGDTEFTLSYLAVHEQSVVPALALAVEVKAPTAANNQLGSGEFDYRFFIAVSKRVGAVDFSANVGYNLIGAPAGVNTVNPIDLEFCAEWFVCKDYALYAEINYEGTSLGSGGTATPSTPEVGDQTVVGTIGMIYHFNEAIDAFTSYSYDNSHDNLIRLGMSWNF